MHKYSEYKDSGVEWIGKIPSHWKISRLRYLHQIMFGGQWGSDPTDSENIVFVVRVSEFDYTRLKISKVPTARKLVIDSTSPKLIRKGDLILEKSGGGEKTPVGRLVMVTDEPIEPTVNSNFTNLIRTNPNKTNSRFLTYLYYVGYIVGITGRNLKQTTGIQNLDTKNLFGELVAVPPIQEQLQISQYLDKKFSRIDSLIEKIERKIKLLKEQRTALISQCVTKGLDPNAEMKDSGVEWIGEIPSHWDVKRLASFGSFYKGKSITKGDLKVTGQPCILYSQIYTTYDRITVEVRSYIEQRLFDQSIKVTKETFLFTCSGETTDEIGKCILYYGDEEISIGGDIVAYKLQPDAQFDPVFLSFVFNCSYSQFFKASNSRGEIVVHIYKSQLRELRVVIPSIEEQIEISQYLNEKTSQIDSLSEKLQRKIELLKEYRHSLISNVVTGKVKVTEDAS